jgi:hypothetical protein
MTMLWHSARCDTIASRLKSGRGAYGTNSFVSHIGGGCRSSRNSFWARKHICGVAI